MEITPAEFHEKNDRPRKKLDKLTIVFLIDNFMGFSMIYAKVQNTVFQKDVINGHIIE